MRPSQKKKNYLQRKRNLHVRFRMVASPQTHSCKKAEEQYEHGLMATERGREGWKEERKKREGETLMRF